MDTCATQSGHPHGGAQYMGYKKICTIRQVHLQHVERTVKLLDMYSRRALIWRAAWRKLDNCPHIADHIFHFSAGQHRRRATTTWA